MGEFEPVREPRVFPLRITDPDSQEQIEFLIGAEYDRVVHYPRFGGYILKIMDDESGLVQLALSQQLAHQIAEAMDSPIDERDWCTAREYDLIIRGKMNSMEQEFAEDLKDINLDFDEDGDELGTA